MVDKIVQKYICFYCGAEFERLVGKTESGSQCVSDQVKCACGNFLPTWRKK